jgi:hypothetical protein
MLWLRLCSLVFAIWGLLFFFFPGFSNEFGGVNYLPSKHAEDWTQIVGLLSLGFAVLLYEAHRAGNDVARRVVGRGVLAFSLPCALLMTYWQLTPDRRWIRLDIINILLLYGISYVCFVMIRRAKPRVAASPNDGQ